MPVEAEKAKVMGATTRTGTTRTGTVLAVAAKGNGDKVLCTTPQLVHKEMTLTSFDQVRIPKHPRHQIWELSAIQTAMDIPSTQHRPMIIVAVEEAPLSTS